MAGKVILAEFELPIRYAKNAIELGTEFDSLCGDDRVTFASEHVDLAVRQVIQQINQALVSKTYDDSGIVFSGLQQARHGHAGAGCECCEPDHAVGGRAVNGTAVEAAGNQAGTN